VILHCTFCFRVNQTTLTWKSLSARCNEVFIFERNDVARNFYHMNETLAESAPAYSTVAKWHAELTRGRSLCDDLHRSAWTTGTSNSEETV